MDKITMAEVEEIRLRLTGVKDRMEAEEREKELSEGRILQIPGSFGTNVDSAIDSASSGLSSISKRLGWGGKPRKHNKSTRRRRKRSPKKHR
jgi:hypothetical protein